MHNLLISLSIVLTLSIFVPVSAERLKVITFADARVDGGIQQSVNKLDMPGNVFVFDQKLLAEDRQTVIGRNAGFCIRTDPGAPDYSTTDHPELPDDANNNYGQCTWTLSFNKSAKYTGSITVSGREADLGSSMIPIIGGTGDFIGVEGVLTSTPIPQDQGGVLFRQELAIKSDSNTSDAQK